MEVINFGKKSRNSNTEKAEFHGDSLYHISLAIGFVVFLIIRNPPASLLFIVCLSRLFATPWTIACQAPLSMEFSRQEYWSELPFPPPEELKLHLLGLLLWQINSFTTEPPGKPLIIYYPFLNVRFTRGGALTDGSLFYLLCLPHSRHQGKEWDCLSTSHRQPPLAPVGGDKLVSRAHLSAEDDTGWGL